MILLSKVSVCEPGGTRGSCVKIIRSLPGSVATIGFTGELNSITRLGGFARFTCATKWTETFPMNNRRELSRNATGAPRRSEEHTSELQSQPKIVCRLLLEQ